MYQAPTQCNSRISPENAASDDLRLSRLPVGNVYSYCVRAIKEINYMDLTPNAEEKRSLTSSSAICATHRIAWESSILGRVTTDPNAGTLPIERVHVKWQLQTEKGQDLVCDGCGGETMTDKGGIFNIFIKVENMQELYGKNNADLPLKLFFSKTTNSNLKQISHRFLCNEGQDICDELNGYILHVRHLNFDTPIHIYDDTSVLFTGKLIIHDTNCPIVGAKACPLHKRISAENQEAPIGSLCVETQSDGTFEAPVVIGSVIYGVRFEYEEHDFQRTIDNPWNYDAGVHITEDGYYAKNNFYDVTKARLVVQGEFEC